MLVAQVNDEVSVAVDVGVEMAELFEQGPLGVCEDSGLDGFVFSGSGACQIKRE